MAFFQRRVRYLVAPSLSLYGPCGVVNEVPPPPSPNHSGDSWWHLEEPGTHHVSLMPNTLPGPSGAPPLAPCQAPGGPPGQGHVSAYVVDDKSCSPSTWARAAWPPRVTVWERGLALSGSQTGQVQL